MGLTHLQHDRVVYYTFDERQKEEALNEVRSILQDDKRVILAYAFGSFIRRRSFRDMDLALYSSPPMSLPELLELGARIELQLGFPVSLVEIQGLSPLLRLKVIRRGRALLVKDRHLAGRIEALAFSESQDLGICLRNQRHRTSYRQPTS